MIQFGRYEIQRELGRGAMGIVYLARDPALARDIALKTLVVPHTVTGDMVAELVERFRREARHAASIKHPCVPEIYDIGEAAGTQYIALEYCPGRNLREVLNAGGPFKLAEALPVANQLLDALETAHLCGVFHRDVKPENVMVQSDGSVKLMDFGIARAMGDVTLTRTGAINGTPAYMAPEQVAGRAVDGRSDLFSFAIMFAEMLTGKRPFDGATIPEILHAIAYEAPQLPLSIAPEARAVINKALNKDPAQRFYTAKAMAFALSACAATKPAQRVPAQPTRQAVRARVPVVGTPPPASAARPSAAQPGLTATGDPRLARMFAATVVALIVIGCFVALMQNMDAGHRSAPLKVTGNKAVNSQDGAALVLIPAGSFQMGDGNQEALINDNPIHTVELSGYWMYRNPVTVGQYKKFCTATGRDMPTAPDFDPSWSQDDHPVVNISWNDAAAYCNWAGVRLPTEAEWEKAARGTEGLKYPWGNDWDPARCANSVGQSLGGTVAVGHYIDSPYGLSDMAGNALEWCADWYDDGYCKSYHGVDPKGPGSGQYRILRGGSWGNIGVDNFRASSRGRFYPDLRSYYYGFRCAAGL